MGENYDELLSKIRISVNGNDYHHYDVHPYYMPFIGKRFETNELHKKILFVGESHYISERTLNDGEIIVRYPSIEKTLGIHDNPRGLNQAFSEIWYSRQWLSSELKDILERRGGKEYYTTSRIAEIFCENNYKGKAITQIFGYPLKSLHGDYFSREIKMYDVDKTDFDQFAYMNFFQRPSLKVGESIHYTELDVEVAVNVLNEVIRYLGVDKVFIMSKISYDAYVSHKDCLYSAITTRLAHPCSRYWKNMTIVESLEGKSSADYLASYFKSLRDAVL